MQSLAVGSADVLRVSVRQAELQIAKRDAQCQLGKFAAVRVELRRFGQGADNGLAGAFDVRMRGAGRLVAVEGKAFDALFDEDACVGKGGSLLSAAHRVVKQVVGDDVAVVEDVAAVGDEGGDLREGVFVLQFGRVAPGIDEVELQVADAGVERADEDEAAVGRGGTQIELHGVLRLGVRGHCISACRKDQTEVDGWFIE